MRLARLVGMGVWPALMAAAITLAGPTPAALAQSAAPIQNPMQGQVQPLADANAALQAGEADRALALLASLTTSGTGLAEAHNLTCRVRLTLEQWDAAANECEQAARLDDDNSDYHLWLGRALGEKASRASFLTAYALAKRTRAEFEEAVRLNPRNAEALSDLGDFYRQAPSVVGGGIDKAQQIATALDKVDAARAQQLRGQIAEQQKDFTAAENAYRKMTAAGAHPALGWSALAGFYARRQRFNDMESAVQNILATAPHDRRVSVTLYDGAGLLTESNRNPALAATLLEDYLASASKTDDAPAFIAHIRLARLKQQLGDPAAADRERVAALALAREYVPAQNFNPQAASNQRAAIH